MKQIFIAIFSLLLFSLTPVVLAEESDSIRQDSFPVKVEVRETPYGEALAFEGVFTKTTDGGVVELIKDKGGFNAPITIPGPLAEKIQLFFTNAPFIEFKKNYQTQYLEPVMPLSMTILLTHDENQTPQISSYGAFKMPNLVVDTRALVFKEERENITVRNVKIEPSEINLNIEEAELIQHANLDTYLHQHSEQLYLRSVFPITEYFPKDGVDGFDSLFYFHYDALKARNPGYKNDRDLKDRLKKLAYHEALHDVRKIIVPNLVPVTVLGTFEKNNPSQDHQVTNGHNAVIISTQLLSKTFNQDEYDKFTDVMNFSPFRIYTVPLSLIFKLQHLPDHHIWNAQLYKNENPEDIFLNPSTLDFSTIHSYRNEEFTRKRRGYQEESFAYLDFLSYPDYRGVNLPNKSSHYFTAIPGGQDGEKLYQINREVFLADLQKVLETYFNDPEVQKITDNSSIWIRSCKSILTEGT